MDEDEIVIVDELPKPPTQCELRHAISMLDTFSFFADDAHLDNPRKSTRNISQIIDQSFLVAKRQRVIKIISAKLSECYIQTLHDMCYHVFSSFHFFKYLLFVNTVKVKIYIKKDVFL